MNRALDAAHQTSPKYRTDSKHPAFWIAQGYSFDEAASRAVTAISMIQLQHEAAPPPPPPPKPDRFADVAIALSMQAILARTPDRDANTIDAEFDDPHSPRKLEGPQQPPQEPFNPDDFPRFRVQ